MKVNLSLLDGTTPAQEQAIEPASSIELKSLDSALKLVCHLIASGESIEATHRKTGIPVEDIEGVISTPRGQDLIVRMQAEMTPDPQQRLKKLATLAVDVQTRMLLNKHTPATILAALTRDVLDRAYGKAVQVTENRNLNFDLKDANALDRALVAQAEKVKKIEDMQRKLAIATSATLIPDRPRIKQLQRADGPLIIE